MFLSVDAKDLGQLQTADIHATKAGESAKCDTSYRVVCRSGDALALLS